MDILAAAADDHVAWCNAHATATWKQEFEEALVCQITATISAVGCSVRNDVRLVVLSDIGKQRWEHVQPFLKETKLTPGVCSFHVYMQRLLYQLLDALVSLGVRHEGTGAVSVADGEGSLLVAFCCAVLAGVLDDVVADVAALLTLIEPSRARMTQFCVDRLTMVATFALLESQLSALIRDPPSRVGDARTTSMREGILATLHLVHQVHSEGVRRVIAGLLAALPFVAGPPTLAIELIRHIRHYTVATLPDHSDAANAQEQQCCTDIHAVFLAFSCYEKSPAALRWRSALVQLHSHSTPATAFTALASPLHTCFAATDVFGEGVTLPRLFAAARAALETCDVAAAGVPASVDSCSIPWRALATQSLEGGDGVRRECTPFTQAEIRGLVGLRHEVKEWEWPLLTKPQLACRVTLLELLAALAPRTTAANVMLLPPAVAPTGE